MVLMGSVMLSGLVPPKLGSVSFHDGGAAVSAKTRCALRITAMEVGMSGNGDGVSTGSSMVNKFSNHGHAGDSGKDLGSLSTVGNSTNIRWQTCSVEKADRQRLLKQKGCVVWITGLSSSGKSSVACALSQSLYQREKLSYILDGDNVRHGLNSDLSFKAGQRTSGELGK